jgi:hypothetical protein
MTTATITFDINGETVPLSDASWYQVAPCGCAAGVMVADPGGRPVLTEDDAWSDYMGSAEERRRDRAAGFRMELGRRRDVVERMVDCPHDPKWGVPPLPKPDGHVWVGMYGSKRSHLVPGVENPDTRYLLGDEPRHADEVVSLCGMVSRYWSTRWEHGAEQPTCRRCEGKARVLLAAGGAR